MRGKLKALMAATAIAAIPIGVQPTQAQVYYTINGQPAAPGITWMMAQRGLAPGAYWYDARTGNWGRVGSAYPMGNIPNGQAWSSYSGIAGMGVGGDGSGCLYTTVGWSNC
jgi:hypothetical protein